MWWSRLLETVIGTRVYIGLAWEGLSVLQVQ